MLSPLYQRISEVKRKNPNMDDKDIKNVKVKDQTSLVPTLHEMKKIVLSAPPLRIPTREERHEVVDVWVD